MFVYVVFQCLMVVIVTHVLMVGHVWHKLVVSCVNAQKDFMDYAVKQVSYITKQYVRCTCHLEDALHYEMLQVKDIHWSRMLNAVI